MSEISAQIKITGDDNKETRQIISEILLGAEALMKVAMTEGKHGRQSKRGRGTHTASAAGEAPAVDTGFLINSIQTQMISDTKGEITVNAEYAEYLEEGTSKMAARPFAENAIEGIIERFSKGGIISGAMK